MTCKEVELAIEQEGLLPLPAVAKTHIAACEACRTFVEDLFAVVNAAHSLPAEVDPPARLWVAIRAQLEAEGVIRETSVTGKTSWLETARSFFRSRALVTAAVGLVIFVAALAVVREGPQVPAGAPPTTEPMVRIYVDTASILNQQETELASIRSTNDIAAPVNDSLQENLQILDSLIADCERRIQEAPQDDLAREYLNAAYQQKANLLTAMMERSEGVN